MQFIDLGAQQKRIRETIEANIAGVLDHGRYIMGPEVAELEKKLAAYVGVEHAIACASGTDALLLALLAYGVGPGDAVLTSPFTFIATAEVISLLGATPVFVDIDAKTFNMDPGLLAKKIAALNDPAADDPRVCGSDGKPLVARGIIGVDIFGLPADYDRIHAIARKEGLFVIEDAAQSFGAVYKEKKAGSFGDVGCTSFFPAKPLGCYGDGGMCFTDRSDMAERMVSLRIHGKGSHKYENIRIGINGRLDTLQAAVLLAKFDIFPEEILLRDQIACRYNDLIDPIEGLTVPRVPVGYQSVWAQYSVLAENETHRSDLQAKLKEAGIPTAIYYPKPLHLQSAFADLGYSENDFPASEDCARRIFSLPMHPYLPEADQQRIVDLLKA